MHIHRVPPWAAMLALAGLFAVPVQVLASCEIESVRQALPVRDSAVAPLAGGVLGAAPQPLFMPAVFPPASNESLALERVLLRQRLASCVVDEFAGYAPRTEFDNTPWRFNAGGEGKKFDADAFDAWMKKRGGRIARGRGTVAPPPADATAPVDPAVAE